MTSQSMPATTVPQHERAVLDFIKVLKSNERSTRLGMVREDYQSLAPRWAEQRGRAPQTIDEIDEVMDHSVAWKFDRALARFSQELMYQTVHDHMAPNRAELSTFLNTPTPNALGSLRLNPNLEIPDYYKADYHVQPGGMYREELIGFITNLTQRVYFGGSNDNFEQQAATARAIPQGPWQRMLDIGCGSKSTFAVKQLYPNAEVHGLDISGPLLKYAHKYAEALGLSIHFSQQNAEKTDFPDNSFDTISSCILFHEVPDFAAANIIREGYRILRPGGWFVICDAAPYRALDPFATFFTDWQTGNNGEPYWRQAGLRNLKELMTAAGFRNVTDSFDDGYVRGQGRIFPWVTKGQK